MKSPRIYTYKVTFEEVPHWYWGVHKEKKFGEVYLGSPHTHKWMWEFYTPRVQILEFFPYTDEGWKKANLVEDRIILPDLNNTLCLNEACGAFISLEVLRKSGAKTAKKHSEIKDERGKCKHYVEMGKANAAKNREQMRLRGFDSVKRLNEVTHADKDENGKSLHALRLNENLHRDRSEDGKSLHTLKQHEEKDMGGKSLHAKKMAEGRWGEGGRKIKVIYPDGSSVVFQSLTLASKSLGCDHSSLSVWAKKGHTPKWGKLAGHTFLFPTE
jgi:hypothetical protein